MRLLSMTTVLDNLKLLSKNKKIKKSDLKYFENIEWASNGRLNKLNFTKSVSDAKGYLYDQIIGK